MRATSRATPSSILWSAQASRPALSRSAASAAPASRASSLGRAIAPRAASGERRHSGADPARGLRAFRGGRRSRVRRAAGMARSLRAARRLGVRRAFRRPPRDATRFRHRRTLQAGWRLRRGVSARWPGRCRPPRSPRPGGAPAAPRREAARESPRPDRRPTPAASSPAESRLACRAMNSANVTLAPVNVLGARDSDNSMTPLTPPSSVSGSARIAALPRRRQRSAAAGARRVVVLRSAMTRRRPLRRTSAATGKSSAEACPGRACTASLALTRVLGDQRHLVLAGLDQESAGGDAQRLGGDLGEGAERRAQALPVAGGDGGPPAVVVLGGCAANERVDIGAAKAAVSSRAAVTHQLPGVAPASYRVEADAERVRRLAQAQPIVAVCLADSHLSGLPVRSTSSKVHQFYTEALHGSIRWLGIVRFRMAGRAKDLPVACFAVSEEHDARRFRAPPAKDARRLRGTNPQDAVAARRLGRADLGVPR